MEQIDPVYTTEDHKSKAKVAALNFLNELRLNEGKPSLNEIPRGQTRKWEGCALDNGIDGSVKLGLKKYAQDNNIGKWGFSTSGTRSNFAEYGKNIELGEDLITDFIILFDLGFYPELIEIDIVTDPESDLIWAEFNKLPGQLIGG